MKRPAVLLTLIVAVVVCGVFSVMALAEEADKDDGSGFFIGTELQLLTSDDKQNRDNLTAGGVGLNAGYLFNRYVGLEASYVSSDDLVNDKSFEHYDFSLLGDLPLSDTFSFYAGAGVAAYDGQALAKGEVGLSYQFSHQVSWQAGYTFFSQPDNWQDHIESFDIGFTYRFAAESQPISDIDSIMPAPSVASSRTEPVAQQCAERVIKQQYVVRKGDWLRKIARDYKMSWNDFYKLNRNFVQNQGNLNIIQPGEAVSINIHRKVCSHP